jgi:hypothetical protein
MDQSFHDCSDRFRLRVTPVRDASGFDTDQPSRYPFGRSNFRRDE